MNKLTDEIKVVYTDKAPKPIGPYSQAIIYRDLIFLSGQIPINPDTGEVVNGDIAEQTKQVLENIKSILNEAGSDLSKVLKVTVFLRDLSLFSRFNEIYGSFFNKHAPARTTVEVSNLPKGVLLEIDVIAVK